MMFKSSLSILASAVLLSTAAFAASDVPEACPSVNAIKSVGFSAGDLNQFDVGAWYVLSTTAHDYGTDNDWLFVMGILEGETEDDAMAAGFNMMSSLNGNPEPEDAEGGYACVYNVEDGMAVAVTGIDFISKMRIIQLVHGR